MIGNPFLVGVGSALPCRGELPVEFPSGLVWLGELDKRIGTTILSTIRIILTYFINKCGCDRLASIDGI